MRKFFGDIQKQVLKTSAGNKLLDFLYVSEIFFILEKNNKQTKRNLRENLKLFLQNQNTVAKIESEWNLDGRCLFSLQWLPFQ